MSKRTPLQSSLSTHHNLFLLCIATGAPFPEKLLVTSCGLVAGIWGSYFQMATKIARWRHRTPSQPQKTLSTPSPYGMPACPSPRLHNTHMIISFVALSVMSRKSKFGLHVVAMILSSKISRSRNPDVPIERLITRLGYLGCTAMPGGVPLD